MIEDTVTLIPSPPPPILPGERYQDLVTRALVMRRRALDGALRQMADNAALATSAAYLVAALRSGKKVLVAGNGGSAAEAQHFAAELVGRFRRDRAPYAALALTTDTSILTAIANDYGYVDVFARQVLGLGQEGDVLVVFSTSGESENLVHAARTARQRELRVIALTGEQQSSLSHVADVTVNVPLRDTPLIQEVHMAVLHILCDIVETELTTHQGEVHA